MYRYLPAIQAFYPDGRKEVVHLGDPEHQMQPLIAYLVPGGQIVAHRAVHLEYRSADGVKLGSSVPSVGLNGLENPPPGLKYPVQASWTGDLVSPEDDLYRFGASPGAQLTIDGLRVSSNGRTSVHLSRGLHSFRFSVRLGTPTGPAALQWARGPAPLTRIPRLALWDGHVPAVWTARIAPTGVSGSGGPSISRRDSFLGFRNAGQALGVPGPFDGVWQTTLTVKRPSRYVFDVNASAVTSLSVGPTRVVYDAALGPAPEEASGSITLQPGRYPVIVEYHAGTGPSYLELQWQRPGGHLEMMMGAGLSPPK